MISFASISGFTDSFNTSIPFSSSRSPLTINTFVLRLLGTFISARIFRMPRVISFTWPISSSAAGNSHSARYFGQDEIIRDSSSGTSAP